MRYWSLAGTGAILIILAGCSSMSVTTDYDPGADFAAYTTYDWVKQRIKLPPRRQTDAELMERSIRMTMDSELEARGFERTQSGKPDLLVAYHIGAENKLDVSRYGYRYGPRSRWVGHHVEVRRYKEGALIIDIVDTRTEQLVWRGAASGSVYDAVDFERKITEAIRKMMEGFPPEQR